MAEDRKKKEKGKKSKPESEVPSSEIAEDPKKKEKNSKKAEKIKEEPKKKGKKSRDDIEAEEPDESEVIVSPDGQKRVTRPLPPSLKDTATMIAGPAKPIPPKPGAKPAPEKPAKKEKERIPIDPSQVHVHEVEIPEDLKKYQKGCLLKIRKVGNSRFSQEMTRAANQLFIKKLGRGQYFVPDYYVLSEIQAWARKWETSLEYMPLDDDIREAHMVDVKSKMSATGEDLPKKIKELTRDLKMREDQFIKIQMRSEEEKANLSAEIENLHNQLDQGELRIADLEAKQDDTETGSGAAEIAILRDRVQSLENENGELRAEADKLREQIAELKKVHPKAVKGPAPVEVVQPAPVVEPETPVTPAKPAGKTKPAAKEKPAEKTKPPPKAKPTKGKKKEVEEEIPDEDVAELEGLSDILEQPEQPEPEEEEEPVDEEELAKAMAYKKPKWDDDDTSVEVSEDENVEMTDEELEEYEREQKQRESGEAGEDSDEDIDEDSDEG